MGWHLPVFFASSPDQTQPGRSSERYRATISAVFKNVPRDARPVSCATTSQLTRCTRVKPVLRRCADRYHRRGQLYPRKRWGFGRSHSKRFPERGCFGISERSRVCAHFFLPMSRRTRVSKMVIQMSIRSLYGSRNEHATNINLARICSKSMERSSCRTSYSIAAPSVCAF